MTNTEKRLEEYFKSLGYTLFEIKDSVFREEKSTFVFQTDNKNNTVDCSTILYDHAVKIYQARAEERERVNNKIEEYFDGLIVVPSPQATKDSLLAYLKNPKSSEKTEEIK